MRQLERRDREGADDEHDPDREERPQPIGRMLPRAPERARERPGHGRHPGEERDGGDGEELDRPERHVLVGNARWRAGFSRWLSTIVYQRKPRIAELHGRVPRDRDQQEQRDAHQGTHGASGRSRVTRSRIATASSGPTAPSTSFASTPARGPRRRARGPPARVQVGARKTGEREHDAREEQQSGLTRRAARKTPRFAVTISPARRPTRGPPSVTPSRAVRAAHATAARATAAARPAAWGRARQRRRHQPVEDRRLVEVADAVEARRDPVAALEHPRAISAWKPSGGSRNGALPSPREKSAAATRRRRSWDQSHRRQPAATVT